MEIVTIADRPDLAPLVADWLWTEFWQGAKPQEDVHAWVAASTARRGTQQTFVALVGGRPVATATFSDHDLDERPELTPWLAGVFVLPEQRGHGHAARMVACVEGAAREAGVETLWLYTTRAEGLYLKLGWERTEEVPRDGKRTAIVMRKRLS